MYFEMLDIKYGGLFSRPFCCMKPVLRSHSFSWLVYFLLADLMAAVVDMIICIKFFNSTPLVCFSLCPWHPHRDWSIKW